MKKIIWFISFLCFTGSALADDIAAKRLRDWCVEMDRAMVRLGWKVNACDGLPWEFSMNSVQGRPLVYGVFGNRVSQNTTLILSAVHGDEITPVYLGFRLAHWLKEHPEFLKDSRVVIAPMVNPDGFLRDRRTRYNARGVDLNRNMLTADARAALARWKANGSNPRRYPGPFPGSEPETIFQEDLIRQFSPPKIASIHSPLDFTDFDGPHHRFQTGFSVEFVNECERLRRILGAFSRGSYPGSLGRRGKDLKTPIVTLELPSADSRKAETYWNRFSPKIQTMIQFVIPHYTASNMDAKMGS